MRYSNEVYKAIDDYIGDRPEIDSDELANFVESVVPAPDTEKLKKQYYRLVGQRRIRLRRDAARVRVYFSTGERHAGKYINAETTLDADKAAKAEERQKRQVRQTVKNIRKLQHRRAQITGQMSFDEWEKLMSDILGEQK